MNKIASIITLWLVCIVIAHAETPKAGLSVTTLNSGQWPAEYKLSLTVPEDHHAYLDQGEENAYIPVAMDPKGKLAASHLKIISSLLKLPF
jgi:thiol:disulfide interchange protein DsbD